MTKEEKLERDEICKEAVETLWKVFKCGGGTAPRAGRLLRSFHGQSSPICWDDALKIGHDWAVVILFQRFMFNAPFSGLNDLGLTREQVAELPMPEGQ
ncbi:hypothetical protein [Pelagivirga sediminicola]|uniref:hypothetical protein n=1 Tax=Pelagivirga sediminicola TaxID=2170575 RepID=UPI001057342A|nr:hypothetical protein [Pelagivirga sediminicola]